MIINSSQIKLSLSKEIMDKYNLYEMAFFDIETTGFHKQDNNIILISLGYFENSSDFKVIQYYADELLEEAKILTAFNKDIKKFPTWCSYNGIAFDEPFIKNKMNLYNLKKHLPKRHVDLYRKIRPYYKELGITRCNLKSVEKFVGVIREDKIDGGLSVELYEQFLKTKDIAIRNIIMLHNFEDVTSLPIIFKIIYEIDNNNSLVREDVITEKQLKFLKSLLKRQSVEVDMDLTRISKKAASRAIDSLLKDECDKNIFNRIINNSY